MAPYVVAVILLLAVGDGQCSYITDEDKCLGASLAAAYFILNGRFFEGFFTKNRCKLGEFG